MISSIMVIEDVKNILGKNVLKRLIKYMKVYFNNGLNNLNVSFS